MKGKTAAVTIAALVIFQVAALAQGGNSPANQPLPTPDSRPSPVVIPAPEELKATPGDGKVALRWKPVPSATGYKLNRTAAGKETTFTTATPAYDDTQVTNGTEYSYTVRGVSGTTEGQPSAAIAVKPIAASPAPPPPVNTATAAVFKEAEVVAKSQDGTSVTLRSLAPDGKSNREAPSETLAVGSVLKGRLTDLNPKDRIRYRTGSDGKELLDFYWKPRTNPTLFPGWLLLLFWMGIWLIAAIPFVGSPTSLYKGEDNRFSNSKFQMVIWFWLLISSYTAMLVVRASALGADFIGGVNIPQNLLLLSGLSALTFAGAKGITQAQIDEHGEEWKTKAEKPRPSDLWRSDNNQIDFGDFQMLVITLLAVAVYFLEVSRFLEVLEYRNVVPLPDVDTTILSAFGLGQGAYLIKKYVTAPQPRPNNAPAPVRNDGNQAQGLADAQAPAPNVVRTGQPVKK